MRAQLTARRRRYENAAARLGQLDPRLVLARGYAIVLDSSGAVIHGAAATPTGTDVKIVFAQDAIRARVTGTEPA